MEEEFSGTESCLENNESRDAWGSGPPSSAIMIQILRKDGFVLNPSDKTVNALLKMIERNEGKCPCSGNTSEDLNCPCSNYRLHNECTCGLYKKIGE